jgi:hypothetical protein
MMTILNVARLDPGNLLEPPLEKGSCASSCFSRDLLGVTNIPYRSRTAGVTGQHPPPCESAPTVTIRPHPSKVAT